MLLTVEGGGLFSSSASGYSKFLSSLLFGQNNNERLAQVDSWSQYQLIEKEINTDNQLAPRKHWFSHGCSFFPCFCHSSRSSDGGLALKVGPADQVDLLPDSSFIPDKNGCSTIDTHSDEFREKILLKSSIKNASLRHPVIANQDWHETVDEALLDDALMGGSDNLGSRKVQWTDACGKELVEIKEFEASDVGASDEESEHDSFKQCGCIIQ